MNGVSSSTRQQTCGKKNRIGVSIGELFHGLILIAIYLTMLKILNVRGGIDIKLTPHLHSREVFSVKIPRLFLFQEVIVLNEK